MKQPPKPWQAEDFDRAVSLLREGWRGVALTGQQRTGKTWGTLALGTALAERGSASWGLIVAPNCLVGTWLEAIRDFCELDEAVDLTDAPMAERGTLLASYLAQPGFFWAVTNYETLSRGTMWRERKRWLPTQRLAELREACHARPGLVVYDEFSLLRNPRGMASMAARYLRPAFPFRLGLSATLLARSILNAWAPCAALLELPFGHGHYTPFQNEYAHTRLSRAPSGRRYVEVLGPKNEDRLKDQLAEFSVRRLRSECGMAESEKVTLHVQPSAQQRQHFAQLRREAASEFDGGTIDGRNVLQRYQAMRQLVQGFAYVRDAAGVRTTYRTEENPKLAAVVEYLELALEDPTAKAVVFCEHREELDALRLACGPHWPTVELHGDTPKEQRERDRLAFAEPGGPRVIIAMTACGQYGLDWTAAQHVVFSSLPWYWEPFDQARARILGPRQTRPTTEVVVQMDGTLDEQVRATIDSQGDFAHDILGDPRRAARRLTAQT